MQLDPHLTSLTYALGGIMVSTVAVVGGLRLITFRRALELHLALDGREIPEQVSLYLAYSIKALHITAGWFVLAVLFDLAVSRAAPHALLNAVGGYASVLGLLCCSLMLMILAAADFRIKVNRVHYRVMQMIAGCLGLAVSVLGAVAMVMWGRLWQMPS
ncbi:MAG: hypothetical protein IT462_15715 [Planctomycetes bacterium]|nr:hypothetical protein [Planctomycetota bacterium]